MSVRCKTTIHEADMHVGGEPGIREEKSKALELHRSWRKHRHPNPSQGEIFRPQEADLAGVKGGA